MLRIGICDDEICARDTLRIQLEKILDEQCETVVYEFSSGTGVTKWLNHHPGEIDLLFLDVEMAEQNGMETAKAIRRFDQELMIVFVTGYTDYVFDGYQVNALDYIIKPASESRLQSLLKRVRDVLCHRQARTFTFKNTDGTFRIPFGDILYFYSDKRIVTLVTIKKNYFFYAKLDALTETIHNDFVRIHQRYLVNPKYVTHIANNGVTIGDKELPISRGLKEVATSRLPKQCWEGNFDGSTKTSS